MSPYCELAKLTVDQLTAMLWTLDFSSDPYAPLARSMTERELELRERRSRGTTVAPKGSS